MVKKSGFLTYVFDFLAAIPTRYAELAGMILKSRCNYGKWTPLFQEIAFFSISQDICKPQIGLFGSQSLILNFPAKMFQILRKIEIPLRILL